MLPPAGGAYRARAGGGLADARPPPAHRSRPGRAAGAPSPPGRSPPGAARGRGHDPPAPAPRLRRSRPGCRRGWWRNSPRPASRPSRPGPRPGRRRPGRRSSRWLERMFALKREQAACQLPDLDPYDALMDDYEPGAPLAAIAARFEPAARRDRAARAGVSSTRRGGPMTRSCTADLSRGRPAPVRARAWPRGSGSISTAAGSTPPRIRSATTHGSRRLPDHHALGRAVRCRPPCSACSTRRGMGSTSRGCRASGTGCPPARRPRSASTSRSRGSGKTSWAGRPPSGSGASPSRRDAFPDALAGRRRRRRSSGR